jgi:hypothetical protein
MTMLMAVTRPDLGSVRCVMGWLMVEDTSKQTMREMFPPEDRAVPIFLLKNFSPSLFLVSQGKKGMEGFPYREEIP